MEFVDIKCLESLLIEGNELVIANESASEKLMNIGKKIVNVVKSAIKVILNFISKIINVISSKAKNTKESVNAKLQGYTKINSSDLYAVIDVASSFMITTQSYITRIFITQQKVDIAYLASIGTKLRECENKIVGKTRIVEQKYKNKKCIIDANAADKLLKSFFELKEKFQNAYDKLNNIETAYRTLAYNDQQNANLYQNMIEDMNFIISKIQTMIGTFKVCSEIITNSEYSYGKDTIE